MRKSSTGRAKAVIVGDGGESGQAAIAAITCQIASPKRRARATFSGCVDFQQNVRQHIRTAIIPLADRILEGLGLAPPNCELAMVNPGFASASKLPLRVSGFSADVPMLLSMLSAALDLPLAGHVVSTGHIASPEGDISMVRDLAQKIEAAAVDPAVQLFVCPALDRDASLQAFTPRQWEEARGAVARWKGEIRIVQVRDIAALLESAFDSANVVMASLRRGFFEAPPGPEPADTPVGRAIRFLTQGNNERFWQVLEESLIDEKKPLSKALLAARARWQIERGAYPRDLGHDLLALVATLPTHLLRRKGLLPLLPMKLCIRLSQFASPDDYEDVRYLDRAVHGEGFRKRPMNPVERPPSTTKDNGRKNGAIEARLQWTLSQLDKKTMAAEIGSAIDGARLCFLPASVSVDSDEEFYQTIHRFYAHLLRHIGEISGSAHNDSLADAAHDLLRAAYWREGGIEAALAEARWPVKGGMRRVLDMMTDRFKGERTEKRINRALKESLDPLSWTDRVAFARCFLRRIEPDLPEELSAKKAEQCAHHHQELVRAYADSMENLKDALRRL